MEFKIWGLLSILFRLSTAGALAYGISYSSPFGGPFSVLNLVKNLQYLTTLTVILNIAYYILSILLCMCKKYKKTSSFALITLSVSIAVTTLFWGIYFYDKKMLYTPEKEKIIPAWWNHLTHTWITVSMIIDFILWKPVRPSFQTPLIITVLGSVGYIGFLEYSVRVQRNFIYPMLAQMRDADRLVLFGIAFTCILASHFMAHIVLLAMACSPASSGKSRAKQSGSKGYADNHHHQQQQSQKQQHSQSGAGSKKKARKQE